MKEAGAFDRILCLIFCNIYKRKIREPVIKQLYGIIKLIRRLFLQDDTNQAHIISFCAGDKGLSGLFGVPGFTTLNSFISNFSGNELVLITDIEIVRLGFGCFKMIITGIANLCKLFILEKGSGNQG